MANVFNRKTKQYLKSVHTPDYPKSQWIVNPEFVPDCEPKYMIVEGNTIREMTIEEKAVVNYVAPAPETTAEELAQLAADERRQNIKTEIEKIYTTIESIDIMVTALAELLSDNVAIQELNDVVIAAKAKYPEK